MASLSYIDNALAILSSAVLHVCQSHNSKCMYLSLIVNLLPTRLVRIGPGVRRVLKGIKEWVESTNGLNVVTPKLKPQTMTS